MNKLTIALTALLVIGLIAGAIFTFNSVYANKATVASCDGSCNKQQSCGSEGCGSTTSGSCGCSKTSSTVSGDINCPCGCNGTCNGTCGSTSCTCGK